MADIPRDPNAIVWIKVPLDGATAERLGHLSDVCHADPVKVASSLLHDILKDDEDAHLLLTAPAASPAFN